MSQSDCYFTDEVAGAPERRRNLLWVATRKGGSQDLDWESLSPALGWASFPAGADADLGAPDQVGRWSEGRNGRSSPVHLL